MSLARTFRPFLHSRVLLSPALRPTSRLYATDGVKTAADGASDKTIENAKPKILSQSPPKEGEESEDVKAHNESMAKRAEKPHGKVDQQDVDNDKVSKGFWKGDAGKGPQK